MAEYIRRHRRIPEATARSFIQQLAAGLKAMWQSNFVHVSLSLPIGLFPFSRPLFMHDILAFRIATMEPRT